MAAEWSSGGGDVNSRLLEELTLNAWPPLHVLFFDGWILGFSHGYTRRANSIHPLYPGSLPIHAKLSVCEATYAARGSDTTFKLTSTPPDADLDRALEIAGYARIAPTSVQTANLADLSAAWDLAEGEPGVVVSTTLQDAWFADLNTLTVTPQALQATERQLLENIAPPHVFATISLDGHTLGLGLAVAERGHVGLFDIVVDPRARNQGLARRLCHRLLEWGREQGAATGYLAVMADNAPALHLYARLGFREAYTYWYRHRPRV